MQRFVEVTIKLPETMYNRAKELKVPIKMMARCGVIIALAWAEIGEIQKTNVLYPYVRDEK